MNLAYPRQIYRVNTALAKAQFMRGIQNMLAWNLSELKRLRQLEDENNRLKRMYATLSMDFDLMKESLAKKLNQDLSGEKWREI
jgi:hypothetical protein